MSLICSDLLCKPKPPEPPVKTPVSAAMVWIENVGMSKTPTIVPLGTAENFYFRTQRPTCGSPHQRSPAPGLVPAAAVEST
jgi:hypothetical protein